MKYFFKARDGREINVTEWSDVENPKGIIQISHGMAEHSGRYDDFARFMNERGYVVFADDHRAHGETDRKTLGFANGDIFNDTLSDLGQLTDHYKEKFGLPVVFFGHSYGSFLGQRYAQEHGDKVVGIILGGSSRMPNGLLGFAKALSKTACMFGLSKKPAKLLKKMTFDSYNNKFDYGTFISSILDECKRYDKDGLCGFICSYNFYYRFFSGTLDAYKKQNLNKLKGTPIMLISGKEDPVGDMGEGVIKLENLYKDYSQPVKTVFYDDVRHEYFNDVSKEQAFYDVANFCDELIRA